MTAPVKTDQTFDEMEASLAPAPEKPKLTEIKLEGDDVPEDLRGKSVDELVKLAKGLGESLKLSEHARLSAAAAAPAPVAAPPAPPEPKEMTDEELAELHATDPIKAMRVMQDQAVRIAQRNLEARVSPLITGTSSAVETSARVRYPQEFEVLGSEISSIIQSLPNKQILSDPAAWDQIVAHARGLHYEKFEAFRAARKGATALATARTAQAESVGATFAPVESSLAGRTPVVIDDYTKEIARNLGMTIEEYTKWSKV